MKIIVQFSGGKDSQASLIWAVNKYGAKNVTAVFCDTLWEHELTYKHIDYVVKDLNVELITLKSVGLIELSRQKKRFPSVIARFCTDHLKIRPFIDWLIDSVQDNVIIIQGIRAMESVKRSRMSEQCSYFRFYTEAYATDQQGRKRYHNYRKKDVLPWRSKYADDIFRPVFDWSGQEVIDYILDNNQKPNPLYYQGSQRVGCYPCVLSSQSALKAHFDRNKNLAAKISEIEDELESSFFKWDTVPTHLRTGKVKGKNITFSKAVDIEKYINDKNATLDLFEDDTPSCSSYYHLCE